MKRLILLLILFVNLQIVITHEDMRLFSYSTASAQHMTKEAGDNCQDPIDHLWYRFPFSDCEEVIVTPDGIQIECPYCHEQFTDFDSFVNHDCHRDNMPNGESGGSGGSGFGNTGGGGGSGSGGSSGGGNGGSGGVVSYYPGPPPGLPSDIHFVGAVMSGAAYGNDEHDEYIDNLDRLGYVDITGIVSDLITGLDCLLFKKKDSDKYILAFAGTDLGQTCFIPTPNGTLPYNPDVLTDYMQLYGPWGQYIQAIEIAQKLVQRLGGDNVMFVGHSLGGGLAAIASIVTGCTAITYNPAALSPATVLYLKTKGYGYDTSHIYRYIMDNDPITKYQGMESEGARLNVHNYTHGDAHAISTMIGNISPTLKLK